MFAKKFSEKQRGPRDSLLRRGLHEVSSERKVSAQGVMGRANLPITPRALTFIQETSCKLFVNT
jgi:hypothetical protein